MARTTLRRVPATWRVAALALAATATVVLTAGTASDKAAEAASLPGSVLAGTLLTARPLTDAAALPDAANNYARR